MATTLLGSMSVGDIVKIKENGTAVNYIIVHKGLPSSMYDRSCDGVWLLRMQPHSKMMWDDARKNDYENSDINSWLGGTFLNTIDSDTRAAIKTVKIPFCKGLGNANDVQSGSDGLSCKAFLLSGYEVGFTTDTHPRFPVDGARLSYFTNKSSRGLSVNWWLRSPSTGNDYYVWEVASSGENNDYNADGTIMAARPAFVLPTNIKVDSSGNVVFNTAPVITGSKASGSNMSTISEPFDFTYTVKDADKDTVTVKEYLDNVFQRDYTAALGATDTFRAVSDPELFRSILNGSHTIKVIATDSAGNSSAAYTISFTKQVKTAVISLAEPLPADDVIKAAAVTVTGNIPSDATLTVLVTNNARDASPVWEDMSREVQQSTNHVFTNKTAAKGFAFNFKVTATRGASGEQGYISNIGGAFE